MNLSSKSALWTAVTNSVLSLVVLLIWSNLYWFESAPVVLIDELLFSYIAVGDSSISPYSNTIFSLFYSSASLCGNDFLACGRIINLVFWAGLVVLVSLLIFYTRSLAVAVFGFFVSTSAVSFFVVAFLPEILYYFFVLVSLTLSGLAVGSEKRKWQLFIASGLVFGIAMLVKPHSIFVMVLAMIGLILLGLMKGQSLKTIGVGAVVVLSVAAAIRVLIEAIIGKRDPIDFFGVYLGGSSDGLPTFQDSWPIATPAVEGDVSGQMAMDAILGGLIPYLSVGLLFYLPPLLYLVRRQIRLRQQSSVGGPGLIEGLAWMLAFASIGMLVMAYVFGVYVSAGGDDHSARLLLRYSEFLVPFTWLMVIALIFSHTTDIFRRRDLTVPIASILIGGVLVAGGALSDIRLQTSDSLLLYSTSTWAGWYFAIVLGLCGLFVAAKATSPRILVVASSVATIGFLASSYSLISEQSSFHRAEADRWRPFLEQLETIDAGEVVFVASDRPNAVSPMLTGGMFESSYALVNGYSQIPESWLEDYEYAYIHSEIYPPKSASEIITVGNSTLYALKAEPSIEEKIFSKSPSVSQFSNIGVVTTWGFWVEGKETLIEFKDPIPAGKTIIIQLIRHELTEIPNLELSIDEESPITVEIPSPGVIYEIELTVGENQARELSFNYEDSFEVGYVEGMSNYSFGVGRVVIKD